MYREFLFGIIRFDNGRIVCPECGRVMEDCDNLLMNDGRWICTPCASELVRKSGAHIGYHFRPPRYIVNGKDEIVQQLSCYDALLLREVCER